MERIYFLMCSVLVMVVVWKTDPEFLKDYFPSHRTSPGRMPVFEARKSQIPAKPEAAAKTTSNSSKRSSIPDTRPSRPEPVFIPVAPVAPAPPVPQKPAAPAVSQTPTSQPRAREPRLPVFAISTEETNLYATNSTDSPLITVLRKGVIVEPQMEFVVGGQGWTLVKLSSDRRLSGFVNSDVLQREQPVVLRLGQ